MYCPKCGQQQVADNTRFCSRCGLQISGLLEWIASDGAIASGKVEAPVLVSPRRKGITRGAKLLFFSVVLAPLALGLSIIVDGPGPLLLPFTVFLAGLSLLLYSLIFGEQAPAAKTQQAPARLGSTFGGAALPPANNWPSTSSVGRERARTAELAQPPSVTENTTRLLERDKD